MEAASLLVWELFVFGGRFQWKHNTEPSIRTVSLLVWVMELDGLCLIDSSLTCSVAIPSEFCDVYTAVRESFCSVCVCVCLRLPMISYLQHTGSVASLTITATAEPDREKRGEGEALGCEGGSRGERGDVSLGSCVRWRRNKGKKRKHLNDFVTNTTTQYCSLSLWQWKYFEQKRKWGRDRWQKERDKVVKGREGDKEDEGLFEMKMWNGGWWKRMRDGEMKADGGRTSGEKRCWKTRGEYEWDKKEDSKQKEEEKKEEEDGWREQRIDRRRVEEEPCWWKRSSQTTVMGFLCSLHLFQQFFIISAD